MEKQNLNGKSTKLMLNLKEFLAEFFMNRTGEKTELTYSLFWEAVTDKDCHESIRLMTDYKEKEDGSFYYEYGLLKAEEEMEANCVIKEKNIHGTWMYSIHRENAEEPSVSFYFCTRTRIMAFIQHENETLEVAWEIQEIIQQKPILCLESHTRLFRGALDSILEAYSKDEYSEEELQREYCPDSNKVADAMKHWNFYKPGCSDSYAAYMEIVGNTVGGNIGHAIDAAWTWFRTGYVNNFISLNPHTKEINLNW